MKENIIKRSFSNCASFELPPFFNLSASYKSLNYTLRLLLGPLPVASSPPRILRRSARQAHVHGPPALSMRGLGGVGSGGRHRFGMAENLRSSLKCAAWCYKAAS